MNGEVNKSLSLYIYIYIYKEGLSNLNMIVPARCAALQLVRIKRTQTIASLNYNLQSF